MLHSILHDVLCIILIFLSYFFFGFRFYVIKKSLLLFYIIQLNILNILF
jgi:hypothetical protein